MNHILPKIGQFFAKNEEDAYNYLPESVSEFPDGQRLVDKMHENGLVDGRYYTLTGGIATLYVAEKPE